MKTRTIFLLTVGAGVLVLGGVIVWMFTSGMFPSIDTQELETLVNDAVEAPEDTTTTEPEDEELTETSGPTFDEESIDALIAESDDFEGTAKSACLDQADEFVKIECSRELGRALQNHLSDLDASLAVCDALETPADIYNCSYGVFHVYFSPEVAPDAWTPDATRCEQVSDEGHRNNCYTHIPGSYLTAHPGAYTEALAWCNEVDEAYRVVCASGVGTYAALGLFDDVKAAEAACASDDPTIQSACISGLAVVILEQFPIFDDAQAQCGLLEPENKDTCYAIVGDSTATEAE